MTRLIIISGALQAGTYASRLILGLSTILRIEQSHTSGNRWSSVDYIVKVIYLLVCSPITGGAAAASGSETDGITSRE